jgi:pimeloyl-ACP methyl ester carboxylesterase
MDRREFLATAAVGVAAHGVLRTRPTSWLARVPSTVPQPIDAAVFHAMRKFAPTRFGRLAYVERGSGPAAVFLHGAPLNGFQWRGALERLSSVRRCIAPDAMGLGYGEIPAGQDLTPESQVEALVALLDALKVDAVDIVGSDSGGATAQLFVAKHPKRVRTLLLTNCDVHVDSPPAVLAPIVEGARKGTVVDEIIVPWLADKTKARAGLGAAYTNPASLTDESIEVYLRPPTSSAIRKAQFHAYHVALGRNALLPVVPLLQKSQVPVAVVWGTGDDIFKLSDADALATLFPRFRGTRKVDGAKLFWPEEYPDIVAEEAKKLWGV